MYTHWGKDICDLNFYKHNKDGTTEKIDRREKLKIKNKGTMKKWKNV